MIVKGGQGVRIIFFFSAFVAVANGIELAVLTAFQKDVSDLGRHFVSSGGGEAFARRPFTFFAAEGRELAIAVTGAGLQETAVTCDAAIMKCGAPRILSVGVAGALSDRYNPGDIIFVTNVVCHDRGSYTEASGFVPTAGPGIPVAPDSFLERFRSNLISRLSASGITCHEDTVASGNSFIGSADRRAAIADQCSAGIVDMNSAGLAESCNSLGIPCLIIRIVSDNADADARRQFDLFASRRSDIRDLLNAVAVSLKTTMGEKE